MRVCVGLPKRMESICSFVSSRGKSSPPMLLRPPFSRIIPARPESDSDVFRKEY